MNGAAVMPPPRSNPATLADSSRLFLPPARTFLHYCIRGYAIENGRHAFILSPVKALWPAFVRDCFASAGAWERMREWTVIGVLDEPLDDRARRDLAATIRRAFDGDAGDLRRRMVECLVDLVDRL